MQDSRAVGRGEIEIGQVRAFAPSRAPAYTSRMSDPPDIESLARRYLDLWQQNISAAAADPDTARAMAQFFAQFRQFGAMATGGDAAAPSTRDDDIAAALSSIDRRLANIETRLDALERPKRKSPPKPKSGKAGKK